MLFNSFAFAVFLPAVFLIYWLLPQRTPRVQNAFLIGASCLFYGWWDSTPTLRIGIRMSFRADSVNASGSRVHWR